MDLPEFKSKAHDRSAIHEDKSIIEDLPLANKELLETGGNRVWVDSVEAGSPELTEEEYLKLASEVARLRIEDSVRARERVTNVSSRAEALRALVDDLLSHELSVARTESVDVDED